MILLVFHIDYVMNIVIRRKEVTYLFSHILMADTNLPTFYKLMYSIANGANRQKKIKEARWQSYI